MKVAEMQTGFFYLMKQLQSRCYLATEVEIPSQHPHKMKNDFGHGKSGSRAMPVPT